jgi:XTP/dITP diphosphohydrolase
MPRRLDAPRLIVASHNPGKVVEIRALLTPFDIDAISAGDLGLPEPDETGDSFIANAELKARSAAAAAGEPALADDSGLVVPALDGAPGIYSARWAGPGKDFRIAMTRIETELGGAENTAAHFVCALSLCWPDGHCDSFEGTVHGHLTFPPRGERGFSYDPIFVPRDHTITFGEMDPAEKDRISHRADAFRQLVAACLRPIEERRDHHAAGQ